MPWLRHFALFLVFVAALFRPAAAGAFVSAPDAGPQARVGAFELVAATLVGPVSGATCGLHEGIGAAYDENASGYRFAARGISEGAAKDLARIAKSLDQTGRLPSEFSRRGFQQGGKIFTNKGSPIEGHVGRLREADVGDVRVGPGGSRGAQRAVYDEAGNIWYSPDHFETFIPIRTGRTLP